MQNTDKEKEQDIDMIKGEEYEYTPKVRICPHTLPDRGGCKTIIRVLSSSFRRQSYPEVGRTYYHPNCQQLASFKFRWWLNRR